MLSLPDGWLRLQPCDGGTSDTADPSATWNVVHQRRRAAPDLIARGLTIGYAQGVAEDLLRHNGVATVLFDPRAAWRARPATAKQRDTATGHGRTPEGERTSRSSSKVGTVIRAEIRRRHHDAEARISWAY